MLKVPHIESIISFLFFVLVAYYFGKTKIMVLLFGPMADPMLGLEEPEKEYYQIERKYFPEIKPLLHAILPRMKIIKGLNLTEQYFLPGSFDRELQEHCKNANITPEIIKVMDDYETVRNIDRDNLDLFPARVTDQIYSQAENFDLLLESGRLVLGELFSKNELITAYSKRLGFEITGMFYYPPGAFAEWHTNRYDKTGWRVYYVETMEEGKSWFNYKERTSNKTHTVKDKSKYLNIFNVGQRNDIPLWHCVYSNTHRFSIGIKVPEWMVRILIHRSKNNLEMSLQNKI